MRMPMSKFLCVFAVVAVCANVPSAAQAAEEWVPFIPHAEQTSIEVSVGETVSVAVTITFSDLGYRVVGWGDDIWDGNTVVVNAQVERWTGPSGQAVTTKSNTYELGTLDSGNYRFVFKASGETVKVAEFSVQHEPILSVAPLRREVSAEAGSTHFEIDNIGGGTLTWSAAKIETGEWLTLGDITSGSAPGVLNVHFTENTVAEPRTGFIRITAEGALESPETVKVVQTAAQPPTPILSVLPLRREVGAEAGSVHFEIDNLGGGTLTWAAQIIETGEWLTLGERTSGTGPSEFLVHFTENPHSEPRTGFIRVTAEGALESPEVVKVVQAAQPTEQWVEYTPSAEGTAIEISIGGITTATVALTFPNAGFRVTNWGEVVPDGTIFRVNASVERWTGGSIHVVTYSSHTYELGDLPGGAYKFVFKAWGVKVKAEEFSIDTLAILSVTPSKREVSAEAGKVFFDVYNLGDGELHWTAEIVETGDWLTLGERTSGTAPGEFPVFFTANPHSESRTGFIRVRAEGAHESPQVVKVVQAAAHPPILSVAPLKREVGAEAGSTHFEIGNAGGGTLTWTAKVVDTGEWLTLGERTSGTAPGKVVAIFTANPHHEPRTGFIRIAAEGALESPEIVKVVQEAGETEKPVLSVAPTRRAVDASAGSTYFEIDNIGGGVLEWAAEVIETGEWLRLGDVTSGSGEAKLHVHYTANPHPEPRTGYVRVAAEGADGSPVVVTVTQHANDVEKPHTFYVSARNDSGEEDGSRDHPFNTISEAVEASEAGRGDVILVKHGTYEEAVTLKDNLTLIGLAGAHRTRIKVWGDYDGNLLTLAPGCVVRGFKIGGTPAAAVVAPASASAELYNCVLHWSGTGLHALEGASLSFFNNTVFGNTSYGVRGEAGATFIELGNSIFAGNGTGLSVDPDAIQSEFFNNFYDNLTDIEGPAADDSDMAVHPQFVDPEDLNFHLKAGSECRDAGHPADRYDDKDHTRNDLGADGGPYGVIDKLVPRAVIVAEPKHGTVPLTVVLSGAQSHDEWGIASYAWYFKDSNGAHEGVEGVEIQALYEEPGIYSVGLLVTDNNGFASDVSVDIIAHLPDNDVPTASAEASPLAGVAPLEVHFFGHGSDPDGGEVSYSWDFDEDGVEDSTEQNPVYVFPEFSELGCHKVVLTVTDDEGASARAHVHIGITDFDPHAAEHAEPDSDTTANVTDAASGIFNAWVTVPGGALSEAIVISLSPVLEDPPIVPPLIGALISVGPAGSEFSEPVTVSIPHAASLEHGDDIEVRYWDDENGVWSTDGIDDVQHVDAGDIHYVTFTTTHFTIFAATPALKAADVNLDGTLDAVDVQLVINGALARDIWPYTVDVSGEGVTDALDVQMVINAVLGL